MYGCPWSPFLHSGRPPARGSTDRRDTRGRWCLCVSAAARIRRSRECASNALQSAERAGAVRPSSYRDGGFDRVVAAIIENLEILERVVEQAGRLTPYFQLGQRERRAAQLQIGLLQVIQVQVTISSGPHQVADLEAALLP